jgi:hypothetical protein
MLQSCSADAPPVTLPLFNPLKEPTFLDSR